MLATISLVRKERERNTPVDLIQKKRRKLSELTCRLVSSAITFLFLSHLNATEQEKKPRLSEQGWPFFLYAQEFYWKKKKTNKI